MVSVAMATYNGEKYIEKQLESICNQSIIVDEVVICDDGSNDNTVEIIKKFVEKNKLEKKWQIIVNDKKLGFVGNFIKAISLTKGDYIFLADQDDIFYSCKFKKMLEYFSKNKKCVLLNANYEIIDEEGNVSENIRTRARKKRTHKIEKIDFQEWLYESAFPGFSMGFRACVREKLINANIDDCYGHDQLIGLIAINEDGNYRMSDILSGYRIHSNNTTGGKKLVNNYSISNRIEQKTKERAEYKKLRKMIDANNIQNVDMNFLDLRESELEKRIEYLKRHSIRGGIKMLINSKAYPKGTILGDCICMIRGRI